MNTAVLPVCLTSRTNSARRSRAGHLVERGERLVAQQDIRLDREGARDRDALAHAAGQRVRIIVLVAGEAEPREPAPRQCLRASLGIDVEDLQAEQHVVERGAPGHQPVVLEHDADLAAEEVELAERVVADHRDLAAGRLDQAGQQVEHGRLAAAGLAEHGDDLALGDLERQPVDGDEGRRARPARGNSLIDVARSG